MKQELLNIDLDRDEMSSKFGGGIPKSSIVLVEGEDGAGKSILAQRIVYGLLRNGHTATYISSELTTTGFVKQMASVDYNVKYDMLDNRLLFLSLFPYLGESELGEEMMERILVTRKLFEKEVIIFDTLSFLIIKETVGVKQAFALIKRLKKITGLDKTLVFCVDPEHINPTFLTLLRNVSDVYLNLEVKMVLGNWLRVLNVKRFKMSGDETTPAIPFKVEPSVGVSIELASLS